jgi:hydroxyacyl-ACP dehydratase HTD2-like protein with hotdog domain
VTYWTDAGTVRRVPGILLPSMTVRLDEVQLFQFAAVTWNAHRIHYDDAYARAEGYRAPVVQMHLHGSLMLQLAQRWCGPQWSVLRYQYRVMRPAHAGDTLTVGGALTDVGKHQRPETMSLSLYIAGPAGERISVGAAVLAEGAYAVTGI